VRAHSIEHKLGLHGSPTCTMVYGDHGGATGFLVGEENKGLACMFTMMNLARLAVGVQGVAIAETATQTALAYARERRQGRTAGMAATESVPILAHTDVKRMLLTMRGLTNAARAISYATAVAIDRSHRATNDADRKAAHERASLLTPVAKAFSTDIGTEVASLGVQVHGGMGYIEETGAAQHYRDARIAQIYEGTNGIQSIDLVTRKLPLAGGTTVRGYIEELGRTVAKVKAANDPAFGATADRLGGAVADLDRATAWLLGALDKAPDKALAGATTYLRLFGLTAGGCLLAEDALAALRGSGNGASAQRAGVAQFFATNLATASGGLVETIIDGADAVEAAAPARAE
jgi:acyl-CoA dehydrogenase